MRTPPDSGVREVSRPTATVGRTGRAALLTRSSGSPPGAAGPTPTTSPSGRGRTDRYDVAVRARAASVPQLASRRSASADGEPGSA
ncbi:hypothetical protein GCM10027075_60350 [Streptomyces heilongjiangensis]